MRQPMNVERRLPFPEEPLRRLLLTDAIDKHVDDEQRRDDDGDDDPAGVPVPA